MMGNDNHYHTYIYDKMIYIYTIYHVYDINWHLYLDLDSIVIRQM